MTGPHESKIASRNLSCCTGGLTIFGAIVVSGILVVPLKAQKLFSDNFETAVSVSPDTISQQQANNSLASDGDPGPAQAGSWLTYGGEADGGPGLFEVQVTSNVDPPAQRAITKAAMFRAFSVPLLAQAQPLAPTWSRRRAAGKSGAGGSRCFILPAVTNA